MLAAGIARGGRAQRITENSCCNGFAAACCLREPAPAVTAAAEGARVDERFKYRCIAVVPEAPLATIDVIVASMADNDGVRVSRDGVQERAGVPGAKALACDG